METNISTQLPAPIRAAIRAAEYGHAYRKNLSLVLAIAVQHQGVTVPNPSTYNVPNMVTPVCDQGVWDRWIADLEMAIETAMDNSGVEFDTDDIVAYAEAVRAEIKSLIETNTWAPPAGPAVSRPIAACPCCHLMVCVVKS